MLNNILNIEGVSLLPKEKQRAINGGFIDAGGCGVLVEGVWYPVLDSNNSGTTREEAEGSLNTNVNYDLPNMVVVSGYVSGWCCDSCPWNSVQ